MAGPFFQPAGTPRDGRKELRRSRPRDVNRHRASIPNPAEPPAIPIFIQIPERRWPKIFWRNTLDARNTVMVTEVSRKQLAQAG